MVADKPTATLGILISFLSRERTKDKGRTMVKKLPACYGIRKGRGAPVVVHSWSEVVAKVRELNLPGRGRGSSPPTEACFWLILGGELGAPRPLPRFKSRPGRLGVCCIAWRSLAFGDACVWLSAFGREVD